MPKLKWSDLGVLGFVVVVGLVLNWLYFAHFRAFLSPDSKTYLIPAHNLLYGKGFTDVDGRPEVIRTPGYPLLLAVCMLANLDVRHIVLLQHLFNVLLVASVAVFALKLTGGRAQALTAGLLLSVDLPMLDAANTVLSDTLFAFLLFFSLWLIYKETNSLQLDYKRVAFSGFLAGASSLVRPVAVFLVVPVIAFICVTRSRSKFRTSIIFGVLFLIAPLTWSARNYFTVGHFVFSYIPNINMLLYRAAGVLAINEPGDFYRNLETHQQELLSRACGDLERLYGRECAATPVPDKASYFSHLGASIVLSHPIASAKLAVHGASSMMLGLDSVTFAQIVHMRPRPAKMLGRLYTCSAALLSLLGAAFWWKRNRKMFYLFFFTTAYFILLSAGAESYFRFRVPITPLYVIAAAAGFQVVLTFMGRLGGKWHGHPQDLPDPESQEADLH